VRKRAGSRRLAPGNYWFLPRRVRRVRAARVRSTDAVCGRNQQGLRLFGAPWVTVQVGSLACYIYKKNKAERRTRRRVVIFRVSTLFMCFIVSFGRRDTAIETKHSYSYSYSYSFVRFEQTHRRTSGAASSFTCRASYPSCGSFPF